MGVRPDVQEHPCRRPAFDKSACLRLGKSSRSEVTGRLRCQGIGRIRRPGENRNRDQTEEVLPMLPARHLNEVVGAHDPDEPAAGIARLHRPQRIDGVDGAEPAFDVGDAHPPVRRDAARRGESPFERGHLRRALQRVLRRDQPPHLVQRQPLQRLAATCRCPSCAGLNEPPSRPTRFTIHPRSDPSV